ncbi:polyamine aminopropyltransferase 1 [Cytophagales bacterium WSM2-2]|nr:polyamine aminopropyltransferase 1 [Cytophagales bacterium WSM2-2]
MKNQSRAFELLLLLSVFVVATCGLIYELVAGTLASYLLGDSITQFSTIIGSYLFAMGIGSFFSKFLKGNLLSWFIRIEILVGLVGGSSAAVLFVLFEQVVFFRLILYSQVIVTGILVGLELPLLMRILKDRIEFTDLVSRIFTFDYIGALFASLLFPLVFIPYLGLLRTSFFFGFLNILVALIVSYRFKNEIKSARSLQWSAWVGIVLMLSGIIFSDRLTSFSESLTYADAIIYAKSSPYQRIVITRSKNDWRLYLNGNLQFSSFDEYRYHESLIHPGMSRITNPEKVLIMGGGDGMAAREILKYPSVNSIQLVDLDRAMTDLFRNNGSLRKLNDQSLLSPKVKIYNEDAFQWIRQNKVSYDFVAVDFPDPSNYSLGKLYTVSFYKELYRSLSDSGAVVIQATSPYVAKESFWIINETLRKAGFSTAPYHSHVPSFGEWGYILAFKQPLPEKQELPSGLRFINEKSWASLTDFPNDMIAQKSSYNTLNNQVLVNTFEREWAVYFR